MAATMVACAFLAKRADLVFMVYTCVERRSRRCLLGRSALKRAYRSSLSVRQLLPCVGRWVARSEV